MSDAHDTPANPNVPGGKLLNRTEAAALLNMSERTFRRNVEGAELQPQLDARGYHRFPEADVLALAAKLANDVGAFPPGDVGASVFDLLEKGVAPVEIVTRLRISPSSVEALHLQWARMRGALVVSGDALRTLVQLVSPGGSPLASGDALALHVKSTLARASHPPAVSCQKCARRPALVCEPCAAATGRNLAEERSWKEHTARMEALDREQAADRERWRRDAEKSDADHAAELAARRPIGGRTP